MARVGKSLFATMMATIVLLAYNLNVSAHEYLKKVAVKVTAYTSKENRGKTASGKKVKSGFIAVSRDLEREHGLKFGDRVFISGMGEFEIQDRTGLEQRRCVDVYMASYKKARRFGVRRMTMVLRHGPEVKYAQIQDNVGMD